MKYISKEKSQKFEHDNIIAHEYYFGDSDINCGVVEVKARHPKEGWIYNEKCKHIIYIAKGFGTLTTKSESVSFEEGDMFLIDISEKYYFEGNCLLITPSAPAWSPEQSKIEK